MMIYNCIVRFVLSTRLKSGFWFNRSTSLLTDLAIGALCVWIWTSVLQQGMIEETTIYSTHKIIIIICGGFSDDGC